MGWIKLGENRERVRQALLDGYVDEVVMCQATAFDELAAAIAEGVPLATGNRRSKSGWRKMKMMYPVTCCCAN